MGCNSSKATVGVDSDTAQPQTKGNNNNQQKQQQQQHEHELKVVTAGSGESAGTSASASGAAAAGGKSKDATSWTEKTIKGLDKAAKLTYSNTFVLPFPLKDVWSLVSDWNVEYLVAYSSKVSVTTGHEPDHPSLLNRTVTLPSGTFHEILLGLNDAEHAVDYVTVDGPVLFHRHFISFSLKELPAGVDGQPQCQMLWDSYAWAKAAEGNEKAQEKAQAMLEQGVVNAIQVINHTLKTRNAA